MKSRLFINSGKTLYKIIKIDGKYKVIKNTNTLNK